MKTLKVSEVFYSLQGEGARAGHASVFVRLAGCDLACGFCDTEFASGRAMTCEELSALIADAKAGAPCNWIVWTGGEPSLQLTTDVIAEFKAKGWRQAIETNGNHSVPEGLDFITCSPKVAEHVVAKNLPQGVTELRYVRHAGQPGIPEPAISAQHYFLSPRFDGEQLNQKNLQHCIKLCLENPKWHLSIQSHKLTRIL